MAENYGFKHRVLRFVQIRQIRAENRPKSMPEIWNRTKNVVPLYSQTRSSWRAKRQAERRVRVKAAAQHSSSELSSAFTLHFTCHCQS